MAVWRSSFAQHFCNEKNDDGSEKPAATEDVDQGVASGGEHGMYDRCNHIHILVSFRVLFFFCGELSLSVSTISEERERALWGVYPTGDFTNSAPTWHLPGWSAIASVVSRK